MFKVQAHFFRKAATQNKSNDKLAAYSESVPISSDQLSNMIASQVEKEKLPAVKILFEPEYRFSTVAMAFVMFACTAEYFSLLYLNTNLHIIHYCGVGSVI